MAPPPVAAAEGVAETADAKDAGDKPQGRPARQQLLLELDMHRSAQEFNPQDLDYFLCDFYPPSTKPLSELDPIGIADLRLETHHRGRKLFVRTIDEGVRMAAVQSVVEDAAGISDRLAVYNADPSLGAARAVPDDAVFAIKEPFYSATATGGYGIRVDHPSDLVRLSPFDPSVPDSIRSAVAGSDSVATTKSALDWKADGNSAYKASKYDDAARAYTYAVNSCSAREADVRRDVQRNRAIVNTYLKRYETALGDAKAAVIVSDGQYDDKTRPLDSKAYYRAGRAAYELRMLREAKGHFANVKELTPNDKDVPGELARVDRRLHEQSSGEYDFEAISRSSSEKQNRLDHADFIRKTRIQDAGSRGRGLFADQDIAAGELIMCEKGFSVAFDSDRAAAQKFTILNSDKQRGSAGTQAILLFNIVHELMHSPQRAAEFFQLSDGGYTSTTPLQPIDGVVPADAFRILGIIDHNSFACPTVRSSGKAAQRQSGGRNSYHSTGLWLRAAYINHACDGNAMRSFIGDLIIIRAAKDIAKDEEILMPYRLPDPKNETTQAELRKMFAFTCDCGLCAAETATPAAQMKEREEILDKTAAFLSANPLPLRTRPDRRTTTQIERLTARLQESYNDEQFARRPRIGLVAPGIWLCQAYNFADSRDKVRETALGVLRNLGFFDTAEGQDVRLERKNGQVQGAALEAAMHAAHAYKKRGKQGLGMAKRLDAFARDLYLVMHGEMRGFEENYGSL